MIDPIPWITKKKGPAAVRACRSLGIRRDGDEISVRSRCRTLAAEQLRNGSFEDSPLRTAGVLNLLNDLCAPDCREMIEGAVNYLLCVLQSQPGCERAEHVAPGTLQDPCDLCGFFGPYEDRNDPDALMSGAREMNYYREFEPLLGPKTPVRGIRRSSLDRAGPGSCYSWGLIPLAYIVESICRAGYAAEPKLVPAVNALLGAQRTSGGWCRNPGGHPSCTVHALRALGCHPQLKRSVHAEAAIHFIAGSWKPVGLFPLLRAVALFDFPVVHTLLKDMLAMAEARQRRNGSFGIPCPVERTEAVIAGLRRVAVSESESG